MNSLTSGRRARDPQLPNKDALSGGRQLLAQASGCPLSANKFYKPNGMDVLIV